MKYKIQKKRKNSRKVEYAEMKTQIQKKIIEKQLKIQQIKMENKIQKK